MGAVELGFGWRCRGEDRVPGCITVWFKGKQGGDFGVDQRDRDPGVLAGDLGLGVALQGERKGKGEAADLWACGSVIERAGCGARTRAPCCCMGEKAGPREVRNAGLARAGGRGGEVGRAGEETGRLGRWSGLLRGLGLSGTGHGKECGLGHEREKSRPGWVALGFGFFSVSFSFLFSIQILKPTNKQRFEFKYKFEFKPHSNN